MDFAISTFVSAHYDLAIQECTLFYEFFQWLHDDRLAFSDGREGCRRLRAVNPKKETDDKTV